MALSDDLRERVVEAVGGRWHVAQRGSQAFWDQHRQRRALGGALQSEGCDLAGSDRGRSSFRSHRGPSRLSARSRSPPTFAPRIRDLADRRLYVVGARAAYKALDPMIGGTIDLRVIAENWDEILRLAASTRPEP
jgi:hypothetical protein